MSNKLFASSGILAFALIVISYFLFSAAHISYDHLIDTYEKLGSEADFQFSFTFWGYVLPGFLIAMQGINLKGTILKGEVRWLPIAAFMLSGVFFALAGFPVESSGGSSFSAVIHEAGILGNFFFFILAGLTISDQLKADEIWRQIYWKQIVLVWCAVIFIIIRGIESIDGLAQKLYYLIYFLWAAVFSIKAMTLQK